MQDEIHFQWNSCLWILYPSEIIKAMPEDLKIKALQRGKAHRRAERVKRYEKSRERLGVVDNG